MSLGSVADRKSSRRSVRRSKTVGSEPSCCAGAVLSTATAAAHFIYSVDSQGKRLSRGTPPRLAVSSHGCSPS